MWQDSSSIFYALQAVLINIRWSEDSTLFPLLNFLLSLRKSPVFPVQQCCRFLCVCLWSNWGKDLRGIRWNKDYFSCPPPQLVIKHNNNDNDINKNDNSPYNVCELNVSWGKFMDKNYLTFKISQSEEKTTKISDWNFVIVSELCLSDHSVLSLPC